MAKKTSTQTQTTTQVQELPAWAQQYYTEVLGRGLSLADTPYQTYGAPRIAGFTPEQQQAFSMTRSGIGQYQPFINQASSIAQGTLAPIGGSAAGAAQPFLERGLSFSETGAASPFLEAGTSRESIAAADPYLARAGIGSSFATAQPYLSQSQERFPSAVNEYMSPYTERVVDVIGERAGRNLRENLLPGVNRTFIGGGTFGGSRSQEFTARAIRDANEAALAEQAGAMERGYGQAADIFASDAARAAQGAQIAGQLSSADLQRMLETGRSYADIMGDVAGRNLQAGQTVGALTGQEAGRYMDAGRITGDLTQADLQRQAYEKQLALQAGSQIAGLGEQQQRQFGTDVNAIAGIGGAQQALDQRSMDLAYQDFMRQQNFPMERLQGLAGLASGINVPTTTTTNMTGTTTGSGPSTLSQIAGLGTSLIGTIGATGGFGQNGWLGSIFPGSGGGGSTPPVSGTSPGTGTVNTPFTPNRPVIPAKRGGPITRRGLGWLKEAA